jgi:hypothetical protein
MLADILTYLQGWLVPVVSDRACTTSPAWLWCLFNITLILFGFGVFVARGLLF